MKASIITKRREAPERKVLTNPDVYSDYHKNTVVDSRYENLANLIVHVSGSNWKVNYYQQVLNDDTALAGQNPTKDGVYQQYIRIEGLILKVGDALTWNQNPEVKSGTVTGSATIYPPFIPNVGDMFVADVGDGEPAIFEITVSEKLSLFKQAAYRVEYSITDYARGLRIVDLDTKVIDHRYFDMDFLEHGQNPVLLKDEMILVNTIRQYLPIISESYFRKYYSTRFRCMILPRDDYVIYDPFLTKAISHWFNDDDYHKLNGLRVLPIINIKALEAESVYDTLEDQDGFLMSDCFTKVGMLPAGFYPVNTRAPAVNYLGLDFIIYPLDHRYTIDVEDRYSKNIYKAPMPITPYIYPVNFEKEYNGIKLLPDIDLNKGYVFTPAFYSRHPQLQSHIEIQVNKYLDNDAIIPDVLTELIKTWTKWSTLQQFYLTPILLMLMKAKIRGL